MRTSAPRTSSARSPHSRAEVGANSLLRRAAKRALVPVVNERTYRTIQAASMARDIRRGRMNDPEMDLVPLAVSAGDTVLDVGANYGSWALPLSRAAGPAGRVRCFEPVPFTAQTLRSVVRLLRLANVEVDPRGCSDASGMVQFDVPVQDNGALSAGQAHLGGRADDRPGKEQHARWGRTRAVSAEVVALDDVIPVGTPISFIKLDIEGAELRALRGASRILGESRPTLVCEINPWFLDGYGIGTPDVIRFLTEQGYIPLHYDASRTPKLAPVEASEIVEDNYVFVHEERRECFTALLNG